MFDSNAIRADFPLFRDNNDLAYLDSGASAQKPDAVIDAMQNTISYHYANIHRGAYQLSAALSDHYEKNRQYIAMFLNAPLSQQIVFTYNSTSAINMVAYSLARGKFIKKGDVILVSQMEHHANIVPWQLVADDIGATIIPIPIVDDGDIDMIAYKRLLKEHKPKLVAMVHISNVLGTINPIEDITKLAHDHGAWIMVDGSQAVMHTHVDVADIGCDFYVFTGHKIYGPTGIGVLYAAGDWLDRLPPFLGGGDMIKSVDFDGTTYNTGPAKFEAGTPPIIENIGLQAAVQYFQQYKCDDIHKHEASLYDYAIDQLKQFPNLHILGNPKKKAPILSFIWDGYHPHDVATILDLNNVAVRVGLHCAEPLMKRLGITGSIRVSFGIYNQRKDIDTLINGLKQCQKML